MYSSGQNLNPTRVEEANRLMISCPSSFVMIRIYSLQQSSLFMNLPGIMPGIMLVITSTVADAECVLAPNMHLKHYI